MLSVLDKKAGEGILAVHFSEHELCGCPYCGCKKDLDETPEDERRSNKNILVCADLECGRTYGVVPDEKTVISVEICGQPVKLVPHPLMTEKQAWLVSELMKARDVIKLYQARFKADEIEVRQQSFLIEGQATEIGKLREAQNRVDRYLASISRHKWYSPLGWKRRIAQEISHLLYGRREEAN